MVSRRSPRHDDHNVPQSVQFPENQHSSCLKKCLFTLLILLIAGIVCLNLNRDTIAYVFFVQDLPWIESFPAELPCDKLTKHSDGSNTNAALSLKSLQGIGPQGKVQHAVDVVENEKPLALNNQPASGQRNKSWRSMILRGANPGANSILIFSL